VIVACDIDSTISETSLNALFFDDIDSTSRPIEGSVEVLREIARDYQIMYLTARPRFTLEKTRSWLDAHGYPREPVITSLTVADALAQSG
jgi:phosphatidate phosphatase PAH1